MKIGKVYDPDRIFLRHWHCVVPDTTTARKNLEKDLIRMSNKCLQKALELKLKLSNENINSSIFNNICAVIKNRSDHIKEWL